jgi:hypothetical protein
MCRANGARTLGREGDMGTGRLWLAVWLLVSIGTASACKSGGSSSGTVGSAGRDFNGLGAGPGFGSPGHSATPSGSAPGSGIGVTPGFGGPPPASNTASGVAGSSVVGFLPGFGNPSGSAHSGSGVPPTPGAPLPGSSSGRRISDLSASESQELCSAFAQQVNQALGSGGIGRLTCTFTALFQSAQVDGNGQQTVDRVACQNAVDACIARETDDSGAIQCDPDEFRADSQDCNATVSDFQNCINASLAQTAQLLDTFNCQTVTDPVAAQEALGSSGGMPAECASLQAACPGLLDDMDDGGSAGAGGGGSGSEAGSGGRDAEPPGGCENTCFFADDGECDDGGEDSITNACDFATDCGDCGPR